MTIPINDSKSLPRKERERLARQREIVRAARAVFAEKGYSRATLDEIAERAEFGKGTLYNYFESKEVLFTAALQSLLDDVHDIAARIGEEGLPFRESLHEWARRVLAYYHDHRAFCRMLMRDQFRAQSQDMHDQADQAHERMTMIAEPLVPLFETAMRNRQIRKGSAGVFTTLFVGLVHHYIMYEGHKTLVGEEQGIDRQAQQIVSVFCDGIMMRDSEGVN